MALLDRSIDDLKKIDLLLEQGPPAYQYFTLIEARTALLQRYERELTSVNTFSRGWYFVPPTEYSGACGKREPTASTV